ncbi:MAG: nitroreductase family protein [Kurthia sp.]|nr:nitroreductase family protein [Candidatus Kurthia equi]
MDFQQLITTRHSAINFIKDFKMTEDDFKRIFEATKSAPSAYNLQYTNYLVITDEEKKERLRELNFDQYKIHTASAAIIVMGDKSGAEKFNAEKIYGPMKMLKMIDEVDYDTTMEVIEKFNADLQANPSLLTNEIMRHAGLHAMLFMLSAKNLGFDTCPMHIHNIDAVREEFSIPSNLEPVMMITIGKSVDKERPRGYRKPVGEFVQFNNY